MTFDDFKLWDVMIAKCHEKSSNIIKILIRFMSSNAMKNLSIYMVTFHYIWWCLVTFHVKTCRLSWYQEIRNLIQRGLSFKLWRWLILCSNEGLVVKKYWHSININNDKFQFTLGSYDNTIPQLLWLFQYKLWYIPGPIQWIIHFYNVLPSNWRGWHWSGYSC